MIAIFFPILTLAILVLVFAAIRWLVLSVNRMIKARQDLARSVSDVASRLERLEKTFGERQEVKP